MGTYLETMYFRDEYSEDKYPQKLCNYIIDKYFTSNGSLEGKKVLDIGSGKGNHLVGFSRRGLKAYGLDKRKECIDILKDFDIKECNIEKEPFPFKDNFFDFIYSKSVLEHVVNADNFLSESLRVLKPGGTAVMMTPDWTSQHKYFWDDYTHVKAFTRKSLQNAMMINGFKDVDCSYFLQLPIVWERPWMMIAVKLVRLLPDFLKWKDKEEKVFWEFIRFSKEEMLLSVGSK